MLCKKGTSELLNNKNFIFQPKLDGTRAIYIKGRLINRRGRYIENRYPEFSTFRIDKTSVIDGEVIVYNEKGVPDFSLLQSREQTSKPFKIEILSMKYPATYVVFDCLKFKDRDVTSEPLEERLDYLKEVVEESEHLQIIFTTNKGKELWKKIRDMGLEGVIAKKKGTVYQSGKRSDMWLKIKNLNTIDCVIQGYTKGEGKRKDTFGALLIGVYNEKHQLKNIGKVGTGWSDEDLKHLKKKMDKIVIEKQDDKVFLEPELVCEVEYLERTKSGDLRAPSFKRLRFDKKPEDCTLNQ